MTGDMHKSLRRSGTVADDTRATKGANWIGVMPDVQSTTLCADDRDAPWDVACNVEQHCAEAFVSFLCSNLSMYVLLLGQPRVHKAAPAQNATSTDRCADRHGVQGKFNPVTAMELASSKADDEH